MATFAETLTVAGIECLEAIVSEGRTGLDIEDVLWDVTFDIGPANQVDYVVREWLAELLSDNPAAIVDHPVDAEEAKEVMGTDSFMNVARYTLHEVFHKQLSHKIAEHAGVV